MVKIDMGKDFTTKVGARNYADGNYSWEEFYDRLLKPKYIEALSQKNDWDKKLEINFDTSRGYPTSFLSESFWRLYLNYWKDEIWSHLSFIAKSDEMLPGLIMSEAEDYFRKKSHV